MKRMTMMQHFVEMRRRILWVFLIFALAVCVGWYVGPMLQAVLTAPLMRVWDGGMLMYSGVTDGVMIRFSLALLVGLIVVIPVALWHAWAFMAPGLRAREKSLIWPILIMSPILFAGGAAFAYWVLFPFVFKFFVEMNTSAVVPVVMLPAARDYLSFAIGMMKVFGVAFQLPLVLVLLNRVGVLSRARMVAMRRYAIVAIVIVAAVLTPPDVVSQILLALPMWELFEVSVLFMR